MRLSSLSQALILLALFASLAPTRVMGQTCGAVQECGDVNDSGEVSSSDALAVLRKAVGIPQSLICECGLDASLWSWSKTVVGNNPPEIVLDVEAGFQALLTEVHYSTTAATGSEIRISDDTGLRYVNGLNNQPYDVIFGTALVFDGPTTLTIETTGGTTQLTLSGLLSTAP